MTDVSFDTLGAFQDLKAAGFEDQQARVLADRFRSVVSSRQADVATKADITELRAATKADIADVRLEISHMKGELTLLKWMIGFVLAGVAALVVRGLF